jgi:hypothetical protein
MDGFGSALLILRVANGVFQLSSRAMRAAPDSSLGERGEPAFDLIKPGGRGWREVDVKARR